MPEQQTRLLAERYELMAPLGRGTMGTVWRARDRALGREVAVKEIRQDPGLTEEQQAELRERMVREGRLASRINHPSVAAIHDVLIQDDSPWIIMELIEARSLEQVIDEEGPLPPRLVAEIGVDLLGALRAAHAQGITHRDVKPGNVLITENGRVVLTDFGIAKAEGDSRLTRTGMVIGSPGYTAPERARGEYTGPESDIWSLGATLYFAVEGRPAYERSTIAETLAALLTESADPPTQAGRLRPVLNGLLNKDYRQRLGAAKAETLLRMVADTPTSEMPAITAEALKAQEAAMPDPFAAPKNPSPQPPADQADAGARGPWGQGAAAPGPQAPTGPNGPPPGAPGHPAAAGAPHGNPMQGGPGWGPSQGGPAQGGPGQGGPGQGGPAYGGPGQGVPAQGAFAQGGPGQGGPAYGGPGQGGSGQGGPGQGGPAQSGPVSRRPGQGGPVPGAPGGPVPGGPGGPVPGGPGGRGPGSGPQVPGRQPGSGPQGPVHDSGAATVPRNPMPGRPPQQPGGAQQPGGGNPPSQAGGPQAASLDTGFDPNRTVSIARPKGPFPPAPERRPQQPSDESAATARVQFPPPPGQQVYPLPEQGQGRSQQGDAAPRQQEPHQSQGLGTDLFAIAGQPEQRPEGNRNGMLVLMAVAAAAAVVIAVLIVALFSS
nr:serine/threonine-protein kinase [Nonomuraea phyllanthi]